MKEALDERTRRLWAATEVRVHDFMDPKRGKAIPYGVYDIRRNAGWVSVGVTHDTASFAVNAIRHWWKHMGRRHYPRAASLLITADGGGSNGTRVRLWKWELQRFADHTGLILHVSHLPPGTSKWNKIEHRLFSFISQNWRGQPLLSHATIVNLIGVRTAPTWVSRSAACSAATSSFSASVPWRERWSSLVRFIRHFRGRSDQCGEWQAKVPDDHSSCPSAAGRSIRRSGWKSPVFRGFWLHAPHARTPASA